jgi:D-alanyl-D-alanine carboxypeptidase
MGLNFAAQRKPNLFGLALAVLVAVVPFAPALAGPYLLIEADTGRVISQADAGKPWYPASVTKLMTTYLAFKAMREKKVSADTLLTVSENALAQAPSKMGFPKGSELTLDNAIKMLMVKSANDIAVVIAEGIGGSVDNFVLQMNEAAIDIGMTGTRFANPHGLPDENQFTSARDMAILAREILREFPEYEIYFRIPALQLGKRTLRNHNRLIDHYPGADGMKTGFICSSGFNVVATARRDNRRLIAVVFGATTSVKRAEYAARLFERGFTRKITLASVLGKEEETVDTIRNIPGTPVDMRDDLCGPKKKGKKPPSDANFDDDDDPEQEAAAESENQKPGPIKKVVALVKKPLLQELPPSMAPIRVYLGSSPTAQANNSLDVQPKKANQKDAKSAKAAKDAKSAKGEKDKNKGVAGQKPVKGEKGTKGNSAELDDDDAPVSANSFASVDNDDPGEALGALRAAIDPNRPEQPKTSTPSLTPGPGIALIAGGPLIVPVMESVVARAIHLPAEVPMPLPRPANLH